LTNINTPYLYLEYLQATYFNCTWSTNYTRPHIWCKSPAT